MKKQNNKIFLTISLITAIVLVSNVCNPNIPTELARTALFSGLSGGGAALAVNMITFRFQDGYNNLIINGLVGGLIGGHVGHFNTLIGNHVYQLRLNTSLIGAATVYICNRIFDKKYGKNNRNYTSHETVFINGVVAGATSFLIREMSEKRIIKNNQNHSHNSQ